MGANQTMLLKQRSLTSEECRLALVCLCGNIMHSKDFRKPVTNTNIFPSNGLLDYNYMRLFFVNWGSTHYYLNPNLFFL